MSPSQHRKHRGFETERMVAAAMRLHGWPWASAVGGSSPGVDVVNVPGLSVEVKATASTPILAALRQAAGRAGLPIVIWRPNGYGLERIEDWPMCVTLGDGLQLLNDAGYGDPSTTSFPSSELIRKELGK